MSACSKRIRIKEEFEKESQKEMTRPHNEPPIELQPITQEQAPPEEIEEEVIQPPSRTCLYIIPLNVASCFIGLFDVTLGFAVGTYGYYALTDKEVPKSNDDVMAKLAGIVYILLAFMIVVFSSVMFVGAILKRTDLVSPFIIVVGLMSACTALLSFTTGVAVNTDENQANEIAHKIYIGTLVIVALQFFFIRTVNKYYKFIKAEQVSQSTQTTEATNAAQPIEPSQSAESNQPTDPSHCTEPTKSLGDDESVQSAQSK